MKIDLIVTKLVSRFARNTVNSLTTVRRLKEKSVEVYFEKENIYMLDGKVSLAYRSFLGCRKNEVGQMEIQRRKNTGRSYNCCSPFSAKLKCGDCGEYFGSKVWHSNSKYKRTIWQCNAKFKGESRCAMPHLYEQRIKELFLEALGILIKNREEIIGDCRAVMEAFDSNNGLKIEIISWVQKITIASLKNWLSLNFTP